MAKSELEAREKMIAVTTELIKQYGDISKITIRDIAEQSGVGIGLINYHFQTKEKLIELCVQRIVNQLIDQFEPLSHSLDMEPIERLRCIFKSAASFIVENPGISRISMINDLTAGFIGDNSDQAAKVYLKILKEAYGESKTDQEIYMIMHMLMSSMQVAFLRNNVIKKHTGIDFANREKIEKFIDNIFDCIF
ncbi:transcriptional regulator, TetR family [Geosporobacter subterraneus DSM 17957]|uniref:Transcriptional regulator, TetR family n=1 Tax=Geosporobacter subterraneus DSM 17957 TaxID=1121919 RepID=A0A1M6LDN1_9FIRM|nr:TetR/AcrR family transcriptional regulator [Geosporobacter subterraneus]SHJ69329.1 transcriptional regulator, TetR family [Geosporobacter subterraneus DSM 17957]